MEPQPLHSPALTVGTGEPEPDLRPRWRRLLVPATTTLLMFALAMGLGLWQVHRLHWKEAILAHIAAAERAPGVSLPADPGPFQKVRITATPIPGALGRYGAFVEDLPSGPMLGAQMVFAVRMPTGLPLLVVAGWVPDPLAGQLAPPSGAMQGYVRQADRPGWFSASDDLNGRRFFTLDPAVIGPALGVGAVRPYVLVLMGQDRPGVYPQPAETLPRPPNNHLQYAATWFSLGATLLVIFSLYARKVPAA